MSLFLFHVIIFTFPSFLFTSYHVAYSYIVIASCNFVNTILLLTVTFLLISIFVCGMLSERTEVIHR